jgi:hypothetical protein
MTRRDWSMALGFGLCASLLTGCARFTRPESKPLPVFQTPQSGAIAATPAVNSSPYQQLPTPRPVAQEPPPPATAPSPSTDTTPAITNSGKTDTMPAQPTLYPPATSSPEPPPLPAPAGAPGTLTAAPGATQPPTDVPLVGALRCLLDKRPQDAVGLLKSFDQPTQELLLSLMPVVARLSEESLEKADPREVAVTVDHLEQSAVALRRRAALILDKMCCCRWIDKFGVYEPLPPDHPYLPGSTLHVYVELRNFSSDHRELGYETRLASTLKLLDAQGKTAQLWGFNDRNRPERSQTLRHDYFINYSIRIPESIPPGAYRLALHVEDVPTGKSADHSLTLHLAPRPVTGP